MDFEQQSQTTNTAPKVDRNHPLATKIRKQITQALCEYDMIKNNDRVLVCVSGGKDSSILTILLDEIRKRAEIDFTIEAALLDQKQPGFNAVQFKTWIESEGIMLHVLEKDTYSIVIDKVKDGVFCSLCSKLRRAILYDFAYTKNFQKMALGHHRTDIIETTLLNLFYTGKLATMPPKLLSDDERNVIIRPMMYVDENDLLELTKAWGFPVIPCNLCGSQEGLKRQKMKKLIQDLQKDIPQISSSFISALQNSNPSHLLDHNLYSFKNLEDSRKKN